MADRNTIFLSTHNDAVDNYNFRLLAKSVPPHAVRELPVRTNVPAEKQADPCVRQWLQKPGFASLPAVALGAKVMLLRNMKLKHGATNGAVGIVLGITEVGGNVTSIRVLLGSAQAINVGRSVTERACLGGTMYYKSTFPLALAYAMTVHKAQGEERTHMTIIDIPETSVPGMWYVALSRVATRQILRLIHMPKPEQCVPPLGDTLP